MEDTLQNTVVKAISSVRARARRFSATLQSNIGTVLGGTLDLGTGEIDASLDELQME